MDEDFKRLLGKVFAKLGTEIDLIFIETVYYEGMEVLECASKLTGLSEDEILNRMKA